MFFDAHNHLQDPLLADQLDEIAHAVHTFGIGAMIVNGTEPADWNAVARLASRFPWVRPSFGLHPWKIPTRTADWRDQLTAHWESGGFVGEIGLDRAHANCADFFPDQIAAFRWQFAEATRRNLPVSIHCVHAWGPLLEILRTDPLPARGFLLHAFNGSAETAAELAQLGAYFSFSGSFLSAHRARARATFRTLPPDRLLVETDAPFLPPPADQNFHPDPAINDPRNLPTITTGLAACLEIPLPDLTEILAGNFSGFFE